MSTRLACVVFDARQPRVVADFWAELLGWSVTLDRPDEVDVAAPDPDGMDIALTFLPAAHPKSTKNRLHLDLASRSRDHQRVQVDRALALGARHLDIVQGDVPWVVLADPEGNEFCVLEPREHYVDTGPVAAIVVDTREPARLAEFWSAASGWPVAHLGTRVAGLRSATGLGCWLEFVRNPEVKQGRNRLHLDLTSSADRGAELARLREAGARSVAGGFGGAPGTVLADPETNEFCLLDPAPDLSRV
ncbi:VOC family protein [Nocardia puris]|uniref:VOC family protein n=1 Tax=Nocardia puris TaxID=208602 RepID=UPI0018930C8B|nr:VOC family protein [Nocardia puris]MBF6364691.1 VOC family protein [Nocardia puris]MBF6463119.1 VOC family protein [Nocardia puris]